MKRFLILLFAIPFFCFSQLELSEIMKGPDFIGHLPQNIRWEVSGDKICFDKNIENESFTICYDLTSKYFDTLELKPIAFDPEQAAFKLQFQIDNNEISFWDKTTKSKEVLFSSQQNISNLQRGSDENQIYFQLGQDLFEWKLGERTQLNQVTNFINKPIQIEQKESGHLIDQQLELARKLNSLCFKRSGV